MKYRKLGKTGLRASIIGLGAGGPSRLGQRTGGSEDNSVSLIREALGMGINLVDTAESYNTEGLIGRAIGGFDRESIILSTKKFTIETPEPGEVRRSLERSLEALGTDHVDLYHLHAVYPEKYEVLVEDIYPELESLRDEGSIRFIGITEHFNRDPEHSMLKDAVRDGLWDVVMVGFNILNQSAGPVLEEARRRGIGTLVMFAVRRALSDPVRLREVLEGMVSRNELDPGDIDMEEPLGFLSGDGQAGIIDAAYRFCRDAPGVDVVLSGTGSIEHLRANVDSFSGPPLRREQLERLRRVFRKSRTETGE